MSGDVMFIVSEDKYLSHYGRKGMKWYQHIFGEDAPSRKHERLARRLHKQDVKAEKNFNKVASLERDMKLVYNQYKSTGDKKLLKSINFMMDTQRINTNNLVKNCRAWNKTLAKIRPITSDRGRELCDIYMKQHSDSILRLQDIWKEKNK